MVRIPLGLFFDVMDFLTEYLENYPDDAEAKKLFEELQYRYDNELG